MRHFQAHAVAPNHPNYLQNRHRLEPLLAQEPAQEPAQVAHLLTRSAVLAFGLPLLPLFHPLGDR